MRFGAFKKDVTVLNFQLYCISDGWATEVKRVIRLEKVGMCMEY